MGTLPRRKAPIPLSVNRSRQTAPSYSYYDRSTRFAFRRMLLMKPGSVSVRSFQTCFPQTSSNQADPFAPPEGFAVGSGCSWFLPFQAVPFLHPPESHTFQRSILSNLTLKRWSNLFFLRRGFPCCLPRPGWSFRGDTSRFRSFPDPAQPFLAEAR
jgi:hypothetical protein